MRIPRLWMAQMNNFFSKNVGSCVGLKIAKRIIQQNLHASDYGLNMQYGAARYHRLHATHNVD